LHVAEFRRATVRRRLDVIGLERLYWARILALRALHHRDRDTERGYPLKLALPQPCVEQPVAVIAYRKFHMSNRPILVLELMPSRSWVL
jgi:hypothetical protein